MTVQARSRALVVLLLGMLAAAVGCAAGPPQSIVPANLEVLCTGEGEPVVILNSGLGGSTADFESLQEELAATTTVCSYSRAGLGGSPAWPKDAPDPTAGMQADQLRATLEEQGIDGPYVMLGWSWGGIVTQAFAARHSDVLAGVIFEDSATAAQFNDPAYPPGIWNEGGRELDVDTTASELEELSMRSIPLVVLTQGTLDGVDPEEWLAAQDRLAALSDAALHLIATDSGHAVHWDAQALVVRAVNHLVAAIRADSQIGRCVGSEWRPFAGECREQP